MTKPRRLCNTAEGFMAGLVGAGCEGPFRWAYHQWETPFYDAWDSWTPRLRQGAELSKFAIGASRGPYSQGRELLWQLKSTSPFHDYASEPLPQESRGFPAAEYLEVFVLGAVPDEWIALSATFLDAMDF